MKDNVKKFTQSTAEKKEALRKIMKWKTGNADLTITELMFLEKTTIKMKAHYRKNIPKSTVWKGLPCNRKM